MMKEYLQQARTEIDYWYSVHCVPREPVIIFFTAGGWKEFEKHDPAKASAAIKALLANTWPTIN